jgi:hypothetical protein
MMKVKCLYLLYIYFFTHTGTPPTLRFVL